MTEPATNPNEPTATPEPVPAATVPAADNGTPQPAASEGKTLLSDDPKPAEGEPKPAEDKPAEPVKPEGAPEKYEFTAPKGTEYDPQMLGTFSEAAKEANLTQEAAQKFIDKMAPALAARQQEQIQSVQKQWHESSTADKEFGGEKMQENLGVAKKALDQFGTPELRTLLETTGLGNHPEVIRLLYRAGKAISEDTIVSSHGTTAKPVDWADVMYPNTPKEG